MVVAACSLPNLDRLSFFNRRVAPGAARRPIAQRRSAHGMGGRVCFLHSSAVRRRVRALCFFLWLHSSFFSAESALIAPRRCNSTLTVHHGITQLFMLTPTENTALSLRLKYLTLHAERAHLRAASAADVVVADVHEAGRMESPRQQSVVIYIRQLLDEIKEPWGPSSLIQKGIGGAGEAVVWLARKFAQMGYFTEVYGNVPDADLGFDDGGVMWRQFWEYDERTACDVFIVWWDHLDSVAIGAAAKARYVWLHYGQYFDRWPPVAAASINAVFPMSQFHGKQLPEHAQDKVVVSANGLAPHLYEDGPNDTWNLIYASHPFYGLDTLLRMWPSIAAALPNVTLHVFVVCPKPCLCVFGQLTPAPAGTTASPLASTAISATCPMARRSRRRSWMRLPGARASCTTAWSARETWRAPSLPLGSMCTRAPLRKYRRFLSCEPKPWAPFRSRHATSTVLSLKPREYLISGPLLGLA